MTSQAMSGGPMDRLREAGSRLIEAARDLFRSRAGLHDALDRAEAFAREGRPGQAEPLLLPMRRTVERMQGPCSPACRARWHLAWGYCCGCASRLEEAWLSFQAARREADDIEDGPLARTLRLRARLELASVALATGKALDTAVQHADEAVLAAGEVEDGYALARLTACLSGIAQAEHAAGRWKSARGHYEAAVDTALRIPAPAAGGAEPGGACPWADARASAANAAKEVARTLSSLGDADGAREWFDRGRAALDGPASPQTRLTRGVLSLERARCEAGDDVGAPTRRIAWLKEAVSEGLACGDAHGHVLAGRAELELAERLREIGDCAEAAGHARRVEERLSGLPDGMAVAYGAEAKLALGLALLDAGDEAGALAALRLAVERGRQAVLPEARHFAAVASWHLHGTLLGDRRIAEAGSALDALAELVPGLAAETRPLFVALMAYMRGMTRLHEGRHDEAREELESAEAAARRLDRTDSDLVRSAAAGLGNVALECEEWPEAEGHFRRALAALPDDAPAGRRRALRADLLLGLARAIVPMRRNDEALALVREAFEMGMASGCPAGRKVAAHAALIEGDAPMLELGERRRLYETAARLGRVSGLAQGRAIAEQAETRLGDLTA